MKTKRAQKMKSGSDKAFELKKLKITKRFHTRNWTQIIISLVVMVGLFSCFTLGALAIFMGLVGQGVGDIGESFATAFATSPELMFAMSEDIPIELGYFMIARQMSLESDMKFQGYFTTKTERSLENVNLSCIEKYNYLTEYNPDHFELNTGRHIEQIILFEELKDKECIKFNIMANLTYFKCPKRNCEQQEINRIVLDQFIPKSVEINKINVGGK